MAAAAGQGDAEVSGSVLGEPPVGLGPGDDGLALPDLAHREHHVGPGEVGPGDQLLYPLPADAEQAGDLGRSHEVMHGNYHRHHATSHLTSRQHPEILVIGLEQRKPRPRSTATGPRGWESRWRRSPPRYADE